MLDCLEMRRIFAAAMLFIALPLNLRAEEAPEDRRYVTVLRSLSINRSFLTAAEAEYAALMKEDAQTHSETNARRLENLRYKIQALQEDAERLQASLPKDLKADEYMKELLVRQEKLGGAQNRIDPEAEKRIEEKVQSIWRLHERALRAIAEKNYAHAQTLYEEILMMSPDDEEAYLLLGHTCLISGDYEKAGLAFHNAIDIRPSNMQEIPRLYQNILVENPTDDAAMTELGYAYLLLGNANGARQSFEEAVKLNPANSEARRGLLEL